MTSVQKINNKTIARIAAIQCFYQHHTNPDAKFIDDAFENILKFYQTADSEDFSIRKSSDHEGLLDAKIRPSKGHYRDLVKFASKNLAEINSLIEQNLNDSWSLEKLPRLLLSILQIAICEIKFFPETPTKVIINEYTSIASDMIEEQEVPFVNSILDKLSQTR